MLLSYMMAGFEILAIVATIGTTGSWQAVDQLTQTTAACMAMEGGYASHCKALISTWESANGIHVTVLTPDGLGSAPVNYGQLVTIEISRSVNWGVVSLPVSSKATAISTYLVGSGPSATYVSGN